MALEIISFTMVFYYYYRRTELFEIYDSFVKK